MIVDSLDDVNNFLKNYYKDSGLYGNPVPIKEQSNDLIKCVHYMRNSVIMNSVDYSIVMPVHNQGAIIRNNLQSVIDHTVGSCEITIILDACDDNSKSEVLDLLSGNFSNIHRVIVIESEIPLFETICDNIGFRLGLGTWLLEIQADMKMTEHGYNLRLVKPFLLYNNVIAVSGRCCHSLDQREIIGRGGHAIERRINELGIDLDTFYVHEVCNRGPLLLDNVKARKMGYLDEMNYYLEYSEIDMVLRAFDLHGWICGYVPIDFDSPLGDGSTRKQRDPLNAYVLNIRKARCKDGFVATYRRRGLTRAGTRLAL